APPESGRPLKNPAFPGSRPAPPPLGPPAGRATGPPKNTAGPRQARARVLRAGDPGGPGSGELDGRAVLLEGLLELLRVLLGDALLDGLGGPVHQVLGLLQAQTGRLADDLDDLDLLVARGLEDDVEGRLLLGG